MRKTLSGVVVDNDDLWLYEWAGYAAFSPQTVRSALDETPAGEDLVLEVNSGGGSVYAADEIYTVLRSSNIKTRAEIQSLAASAASYLCLGCDHVAISPVAQMMIHPPSITTDGDSVEHKRSMQLLGAVSSSILNALEAKSAGRRSRDELARMMERTTWLTADEALDAGLVDEIMFREDVSAPITKSVINAASGAVRMMAEACAMPTAAQLRAAYEAEKQKQNPGPDGGPENKPLGWEAQARLAVEKNRFGGNYETKID